MKILPEITKNTKRKYAEFFKSFEKLFYVPRWQNFIILVPINQSYDVIIGFYHLQMTLFRKSQ